MASRPADWAGLHKMEGVAKSFDFAGVGNIAMRLAARAAKEPNMPKADKEAGFGKRGMLMEADKEAGFGKRNMASQEKLSEILLTCFVAALRQVLLEDWFF